MRTEARREAVAASSLESYGLQVLAPVIESRQVTQYRNNPIIKPLFPSYIFAKLDPGYFYSLRRPNGVRNIVAPVEESVIEEIRLRIGPDGFVELEADEDEERSEWGFKPDQPVLITEGAARGITAVFKRDLPDGERVIILLSLFGREKEVAVPISSIVPLSYSQIEA